MSLAELPPLRHAVTPDEVTGPLSGVAGVGVVFYAFASFLRGGKYHYLEATSPALVGLEPVEPEASDVPVRRVSEGRAG